MTVPTSRDSAFQAQLQRKLPELALLERLIKSIGERARVRVEATIEHQGHEFPIHSITLGSEDPAAPTLAIIGGVHGLERIGSEIAIAYLQSLLEQLTWDKQLRERLTHSRLVFVPIVNPVGMFHTSRSNGNGVDLMRNSPAIADEPPPMLLGGHTISNRLPWFRGQTTSAATMEAEAKALCGVIAREVLPSRLSLSIDLHSGFGSVDRLWFPYAKSKRPPPYLEEITAMKRLFDRSYPNHFYRIEPQSVAYTTHGDLWDHLLDEHLASGREAAHESAKGLYIPYTLELGSWIWLKKNPSQFFSSLGAFNPIKPHRLRRILRRHLTLFDFLHRAILNPEPWTTDLSDEDRAHLRARAMELWYEP